MEILKDPIQLHHDTSLALGMFDGVHPGHEQVIRSAVKNAREKGLLSAVLLFDPHPAYMLYPDAPFHLLTLQEEKLELLEHLGIQAVIILPFDLKISTMPPEAFIRRILIEKLRAKHLSVGFNYTFGLNKAGTPHLLEISGDKSGYTVEVLPPYLIDGVAVSSSLIRQLLREQGDVALAGEFLGRNYQVRGVVVHGDKRGRSIGFPTANLQVDSKKLLPLAGVYAVKAWVGQGFCNGIANVGYLPTFYRDEKIFPRIEIHLFDFNRSIYGVPMEVVFIERIRDERSFASPEALVAQIKQDARRAKELLEKSSGNV